MSPPTSATLIRPDQPLQRLGPYGYSRPVRPRSGLISPYRGWDPPSLSLCLRPLIRPDQPLLTGLSYQHRVVSHLMRRRTLKISSLDLSTLIGGSPILNRV